MIILTLNNKGGVGKTTLALEVASAFADQFGARVQGVDLDASVLEIEGETFETGGSFLDWARSRSAQSSLRVPVLRPSETPRAEELLALGGGQSGRQVNDADSGLAGDGLGLFLDSWMLARNTPPANAAAVSTVSASTVARSQPVQSFKRTSNLRRVATDRIVAAVTVIGVCMVVLLILESPDRPGAAPPGGGRQSFSNTRSLISSSTSVQSESPPAFL